MTKNVWVLRLGILTLAGGMVVSSQMASARWTGLGSTNQAQAAPRAQSQQAASQSVPALNSIKKIFIEKMDNNLDQYLVSEISKQFKGNLSVVLDRTQAEAILQGVNVAAQNTTQNTVQLVDPSGKQVLWSATAGDRNKLFLNLKHGGEQKIAAKLIGDLKKAMQK